MSVEGLVIRPIQGEDEVRTCAAMMVSSEPWITLGRTFEQATRIMTSPTREVHVAALDGELVGFVVLVMRVVLTGFVQSLAVREDVRGRGIGTALMAFVEERVFRDSPNVFLCVSSFNDGARRFYERLGYSVVGELSEILVPGHSEILMRKSTGPWSAFTKPGGQDDSGSRG